MYFLSEIQLFELIIPISFSGIKVISSRFQVLFNEAGQIINIFLKFPIFEATIAEVVFPKPCESDNTHFFLANKNLTADS